MLHPGLVEFWVILGIPKTTLLQGLRSIACFPFCMCVNKALLERVIPTHLCMWLLSCLITEVSS